MLVSRILENALKKKEERFAVAMVPKEQNKYSNDYS